MPLSAQWNNFELDLRVCFKKELDSGCTVPWTLLKPVPEETTLMRERKPFALPPPHIPMVPSSFPSSCSEWAVQNLLPEADHQHPVWLGECSGPRFWGSSWSSRCCPALYAAALLGWRARVKRSLSPISHPTWVSVFHRCIGQQLTEWQRKNHTFLGCSRELKKLEMWTTGFWW